MERKRTLQEKAEAILHQTLPCGCPATDCGTEGLVVIDGHTCDGAVLKQERQAMRQQRYEQAVDASKRHNVPLNGGERRFRLLR